MLNAAENIHLPGHAPGFFSPAGRADRASDLRLVKGSKSPTRQEVPKTPAGVVGAYTVIQFREWAEEYRVFTKVIGTVGTLPPDNCGPRITETLTVGAARKIAESCQYVAAAHGGYRTFLTLTLDESARERVSAGEATIQREVSRFFDGLQKMWSRGWVARCEKTGREDAMPAGRGPLLYVWVVEVPDNAQGEPNPHVHVLLNWRVKRRHFRSWAARVESLWGQGFAHLEKIKDGAAAGSYMMKAAGYLCKAQGREDQGRVRGNRYGMSAAARAPAWVTLDEKQLHIMGALIADVHQRITERYGREYAERKHLKKVLDNTPKTEAKKRRAIGKRLERVRAYLAGAVPVVAGKYQILFKGQSAFEEFMRWARCDQPVTPYADWLPPKEAGEGWQPGARPESQWFARFKAVHYWRRACRAAERQRWTLAEWWCYRRDFAGVEPEIAHEAAGDAYGRIWYA